MECNNLKCKNEISSSRRKYCSNQCNNLAYYYRNREEKLKYQKDYLERNFERDKEKRKRWIRNWYNRNKARQSKNVLNNYYKNKKVWNERGFKNYYRDYFLKVLSKNCINCGKEEVNFIGYKSYNVPSREGVRKKNILEYLKEYAKFLYPACSKDCLRGYKKKLK